MHVIKSLKIYVNIKIKKIFIIDRLAEVFKSWAPSFGVLWYSSTL